MEAVPNEFENVQFTVLRELQMRMNNIYVKVKVIRVWMPPNFKNPRLPYSIETILMDEEGTKICANATEDDIPKFEKHLVDGQCLVIRNPGIQWLRGNYRVLPCEFKLSFSNTTRML